MPSAKKIEKQFIKAYDAHADAIYRHCFFRIHDSDKAQELMQESFTKTWVYITKNGLPDNIRAFLYKVANNLVIDEVRKKRPQIAIEVLQEVGQEPSIDDSDRLVDYLDGKKAIESLSGLDPGHREVLVLRYVEGLRPKEIASKLKQTQNAISVRLHRAKKQLAELI